MSWLFMLLLLLLSWPMLLLLLLLPGRLARASNLLTTPPVGRDVQRYDPIRSTTTRLASNIPPWRARAVAAD